MQSQGMWSEGLGTPVMSATEIMAVLRSFGMGKFVGAVMWVIHEAFGGVDEKFPQMNTDGHGCPQADGGGEHELPQINRELKENNIYPQIYTDGHRCPQADEVGELQLFASSSSKSKFFTHCQTKEEVIKLRKFSRIYSHIANIKKSSSSYASSHKLFANYQLIAVLIKLKQVTVNWTAIIKKILCALDDM